MNIVTSKPKLLDWVGLAVQTTVLLLCKIALALIGLVVVPIALLFRKTSAETFKVTYRPASGKFYDYGYKRVIHLPSWAWVWDNFEEGASSKMGLWWWKNDGEADNYWAMYRWLCFRNPVNNLRLTSIFSVDMLEYDHYTHRGDNWFFVKSKKGAITKYSFRYRKSYVLKGQNVDVILHFGYKVLQHTFSLYRDNPSSMQYPHHRYRGFGLQIIPAKGYVR